MHYKEKISTEQNAIKQYAYFMKYVLQCGELRFESIEINYDARPSM